MLQYRMEKWGLAKSWVPKATEDAERERIRKALTDASANVSEAARSLGLTRRSLQYRMEKLGIVRPARLSSAPGLAAPAPRSGASSTMGRGTALAQRGGPRSPQQSVASLLLPASCSFASLAHSAVALPPSFAAHRRG